MNHISGENKGDVRLYAISTCIWCKKTKELLNNLGVEYSYLDVDLLDDEEKTRVMSDVANLNPRLSFPTLVVNDHIVVGNDEARIHELLA